MSGSASSSRKYRAMKLQGLGARAATAACRASVSVAPSCVGSDACPEKVRGTWTLLAFGSGLATPSGTAPTFSTWFS